MTHPELDFVVVGPQRTGTTWLDAALREHDGLCLPHGVKETMYYDRRTDIPAARYAGYFARCPAGALKGEVSPSYFHREDAAERLKADAPGAKIVIVLRDPTEKTFSLYLHHLRKGRVPRDLREALEAMPELVDSARYARLVPMWTRLFGREGVHLIPFGAIGSRPQQVLHETCAFLGVDTVPFDDAPKGRVNAASAPRFPWLARAAAQTATVLHDLGLHGFVEAGKRLGLDRVYTGGEAEMPELGATERAFLDGLFAEDRAFVEACLRGRSPAAPGGAR